jgi:signal transduction histidine kinase
MLTAMDGGIYQLETGLAKNDQNRIGPAFEVVKQMAGRIRKMVLEILYYAKSRELKYESISIESLAKAAVDAVKAATDKNGVRFDVDIPADLGNIEVDPSWVQATLVNFLENAVDACIYNSSSDSNHYVKFNVYETEPDSICFAVEDNGLGMDRETKEKMFTLFFTSKGSQGTGLGLFIANRVIRQHGGTIEVESEPLKGSRFLICLPKNRLEIPDTVEVPERENIDLECSD